MAVYIKSVLPSGRGIWLEKLTTRQYRSVTERVATRTAADATPMSMTNRLANEMLLASFRGITVEPLPIIMTEATKDLPADIDVDAMLAAVPETSWIKPTFEDLIIKDGEKSLETLLDDPSDYIAAEGIAASETLGGQSGALRGKIKREFVEQ
jgi:hypothetical protein